MKGIRTDGGTKSTAYSSKPVLDKNGQEIRVTDDPILTADEFERVQQALACRAKNKRHHEKNRRPTRFLGVIKHETCANNINETNSYKTLSTGKEREYRYLRCPRCRKPGFVIPDPEDTHRSLAQAVFDELGDYEVIRREYARGEENRRERKRLEESIAYYMTGLEPGGRFDKAGFIREKAESTPDSLMTDLAKIDPESTKDRWIYQSTGKTYRHTDLKTCPRIASKSWRSCVTPRIQENRMNDTYKVVSIVRKIVHSCKGLDLRPSAMLAVMAEYTDWEDGEYRRNGGLAGIRVSKTNIAHWMGETRSSDIDPWIEKAVAAEWLIVEERHMGKPWRFRIVIPGCCRHRRLPGDRCKAQPRSKRGNLGSPKVQGRVASPEHQAEPTLRTPYAPTLNNRGLPSRP